MRDYRLQQIEKMDCVEIFRESKLTAQEALDVGADHIAVATGATWRRDGYGAHALGKLPNLSPQACVYTPDDIMSGNMPKGSVVVYDDDHYYMGSVIAERIAKSGQKVTLVTPQDTISAWGYYTYDRWRAQSRLMEMGVKLIVSKTLKDFGGGLAKLSCTYTGADTSLDCASVVMVTSRKPNDTIYTELSTLTDSNLDKAPKTLKRIGDCEAPAIIAAAVYSGHRYARNLEESIDPDNPLKHDRVFFHDT